MLGTPSLRDFPSLSVLRIVLPMIVSKNLACRIGTATADRKHDVV